MKAAVLILVACCALTARSLAKHSKPSATVGPAGRFDMVSTAKPTPTNTTTTKPTPTNTTTTKAPPTNTTTTKAPPTNTTTTKAPPTNTTTTKPTTTTRTTTPTTTPSTTPSPSLTVGEYHLDAKRGEYCLMANMALQIQLPTAKGRGTFNVNPNKTTAHGECKEKTANLTLVFKEGFVSFLFNKSDADAYVHTLSFKLSSPLSGDNSDYSATNTSVHLFPAKMGHSYSCRNESIYMGNGFYLDVSQAKMQAFGVTQNKFGIPDPCPADRTDYRVAIAVGVTLLVLIVVVVIAYLLGRKKRTDGYQSL